MNPSLLIVIPLLGAFIAVFVKKTDKIILLLSTIVNVALSILLTVLYTIPEVYFVGGFPPPFGISLVVDSYSLINILILNIIFALIIFMSFKYVTRYAVVLSIMLAALNGVVLTGDLFNLFVFMEIAAIVSYILTTANKDIRHTFNYLVLGTMSSGFFLFGIVLIYNIFGSLNINDIRDLIASSNGPVKGALALPIILIFAGLSVEMKLIPFSGWAKGVLKQANPLVGTLIVSVHAFAILIAFGRLTSSIFVISKELLMAFTVIAAVTLVFAEASAFSKKNLREILLFSSIAQSGLAVLLFINGLTLPALLVLINNVVSKLILFTIAGKLANESDTDNIDELRGVFTKYVIPGLGFSTAVLSLIGIPLFFGFTAKVTAVIALFKMDNIWLPAIILLSAVVEGAYYIRILINLWTVGNEGETATKKLTKDFVLDDHVKVSIVSIVISLLIIAGGIIFIAQLQAPLAADLPSYIKQSLEVGR
ncbi:MAG: complex I subunit 5 family protein [Saccharofermentanales bacterium]